jgi:hypothetical protein
MKEQIKKQILEIRTGSHLYGTNVETSDEDFLGVFIPTEDYVFGLLNVEEVDKGIKSKNELGKNNPDAVDKKIYEFRRFLNLCLGNNPNILESIFVNKDNIIYIDDIGEELIGMYDAFVSKLCVNKFISYAKSQKHKMIIKPINFSELDEGLKILSGLDDKITMAEVLLNYGDVFYKKPNGNHIHCGDICFEPGVYVKKARNKLSERISKATNRRDLILNHGFDSKFGMHLVRLLMEGKELLETGKLAFPLKGRELLLDIRSGKYTVDQVIELAENIEKDVEELSVKSSIRGKPDFNKVNNFCKRVLMKEFLNESKEI